MRHWQKTMLQTVSAPTVLVKLSVSDRHQRHERFNDDCHSRREEGGFHAEFHGSFGPQGLNDWRQANNHMRGGSAHCHDVYIDQGVGNGEPRYGRQFFDRRYGNQNDFAYNMDVAMNIANQFLRDFAQPRMPLYRYGDPAAYGSQGDLYGYSGDPASYGPQGDLYGYSGDPASYGPQGDMYGYSGEPMPRRRMPDYVDQNGPHYIDPRDPNAFADGDPSVDMRGIGNRDSSFIRPWTPQELQAFNASNGYSPDSQLSLNTPSDVYNYSGDTNNGGTGTQQPADQTGQQTQSDVSDDQIPMWMRFAPGGPEAYLPPQQQQQPSDTQATTNGAQTTDGQATSGQTDGQVTTDNTQPTTDQTTQVAGVTGDPNSFFMTQFRSQFNQNGPSESENCGPTSLAMAFKAFGKGPQGVNPGDTEGFIEQTRQMMTGADNINSETTYNDIQRGAQAGGLNSQIVGGLQGVDQAISAGAMVIAAGNPDRPGSGAYGLRMSADDYSAFNGRHLILIVGRNGSDYLINDPLSKKGTIEVTRSELQAYLSDPTQPAGNGGVAVWANA